MEKITLKVKLENKKIYLKNMMEYKQKEQLANYFVKIESMFENDKESKNRKKVDNK